MTQTSGIKLSNKLVLITTVLVFITVISSVFLTLFFGNRIAENSISKKLNSSQLIQQEFKQQKLRQLELVSLVVASDPAFVAYVAQTIFDLEENQNVDIASIADLLLERKQQYGFDVAIIASIDGQQIARSDLAMSAARDLSNIDLMKKGMDTMIPVSGYWKDSSQIYHAAVVPLSRGRNLIGFLITGVQVDDVFSSDMAKLTGTEVVVVTKSNEQVISSITSTLDLDLNATLIDKLNQANTFTTLETAADLNLSIDDLNLSIALTELAQLESQTYYILNGVSVNQVMAPFLRTRNILVLVGVVLIVLSILSAHLLVNHSMAPLARIAAATRQVSLGNFSVKYPQKVGKDLSELSNSIHQLIQDLKGRDALASHMIELSKKSHLAIKNNQRPAKVIIEPGKLINNRFEIIQNIGVGGMGAVFKAFDQELEEVVALKVLKTKQADEADIALFKDEIKIARRISHPNVVRIHDFGQLAHNVYISMEFVQGHTLEEILKFAKKLKPIAAKHAAIHICEGLIAAHKAGVVHKDLKPANIIVELDSSIKLMDFGIASIDNIISESRSKALVGGTAAYMAPEQALGKGADERTDIYALGILMMELFIGKRPFYASDDEELMLKHVNDQPLPMSNHWADCPPALTHLVLKCLSKSPKDRPQTVQTVLSILERINIEG